MATKAERLLKKARALAGKGRREKALGYYRTACELEPLDPALWIERATVAGVGGEAVDTLFHAADLYARAGMRKQAADIAARVLQLDGKHSGARRFVKMLKPRVEPEVAAAPVPEPEPSPAPKPARPVKKKKRKRRPSKIRVPADGLAADVEASYDAIEIADAAAEAAEAAATPVAATKPEGIAAVEPVVTPEPEPVPEPEPEPVPEPEPEPVTEPEPASEPDEESERKFVAAPEPNLDAMPTREPKPPRVTPSELMQRRPPTREYKVGRTTGRIALAELALAADAAEAAEFELDEHSRELHVVQAVAATIGASPLLSELDSDLVRYLIEVGSIAHCTEGRALFMEGESGSSLYLILSGSVYVEREDVETGEIRRLATLRPGAFFGEMALLTDAPRSATVRAASDSMLLEVSRDDVRKLIEREQRVLTLLMRFFRARLVGTLMATSALFKPFSPEARRRLVTRFKLREVPADYIVLKKGDRSDGLYVVLVGELAAIVPEETKILGYLGPGDMFGEMSLIEKKPAMATIRTESRSWVLRLPAQDFAELSEQHPEMLERIRDVVAKRREQNRMTLGEPSVTPV